MSAQNIRYHYYRWLQSKSLEEHLVWAWRGAVLALLVAILIASAR